MYLSASLIVVALSSFVGATPTPRSGVAIPIAKRTQLRDANGVVDIAMLESSVHHSIAFVFSTISIRRITSNNRCVFRKFHRGFQAHQQNTGAPHPFAPKVKRSEKRDTGSEPLTKLQLDLNATLWSGTISVGTPPQPFTGELSFLT